MTQRGPWRGAVPSHFWEAPCEFVIWQHGSAAVTNRHQHLNGVTQLKKLVSHITLQNLCRWSVGRLLFSISDLGTQTLSTFWPCPALEGLSACLVSKRKLVLKRCISTSYIMLTHISLAKVTHSEVPRNIPQPHTLTELCFPGIHSILWQWG